MLSLHAKGLIAQIRGEHLYRRIRFGWMRWRKVCTLCGQAAPCNRRMLADDIEAGRRDISGRPIGGPL